MKKQEIYVAQDGTRFDNVLDCVNHESKNKPLIIKETSKNLSKMIWDDFECEDNTNDNWSAYLFRLVSALNVLYDAFEKEQITLEEFDYYELGDAIQFLELIRIDCEK